MEACGCLHATPTYYGYGPVFPELPPAFRAPSTYLRVTKLSELLRLAKDPEYAYSHIAAWYASNMLHGCLYPFHRPDKMGTLRFTAEAPHVYFGLEVPNSVIESFPHLKAYNVDTPNPNPSVVIDESMLTTTCEL